jgi:cysteine synthase A
MKEVPEKVKNLSSLVGNTPCILFSAEIDGKKVKIIAKYEAWNFTGSIKDRMALKILESAYSLGTISAGDTIVEATSGNTGIAFAAMGAYIGHPVHI